ncbi:MAG: HD-GYP domain-containing protein [Dehalococcoidia bacterium]|nr:MAG: HD-GYP domain-containing protein [Dehalococcoidia bacterium]
MAEVSAEPSGPAQLRGAPSHRFVHALNSPLRVRVYLLIAVSAAVVLGALWLANHGADERRRELAGAQLSATAAEAAAGADVQVTTLRTALGAADILLASGSPTASLCSGLAQDAVRNLYRRLSVFSTNGNLLCTTIPEARDQPEAIRQRAYFQNAMNTGVDQVDGPLVSVLTGRMSIALAHPLRAGPEIRGVATLSVDTEDLLRNGRALPHDARTLLVSPRGARYEAGASDQPPLAASVLTPLTEAAASSRRCDVFIVDGMAWGCSPIGNTGYVVAVGRPEAAVFALANAELRRDRGEMAGVVLVAVAVAFLADILFLRRIRGAYAQPGPVPVSATDVFARDEVDSLRDWAARAGPELDLFRAEAVERARRRGVVGRELLTSIAEAVEARYPFLRQHGDRVGRYSRQIGIRLGITGDDLDLLTFAGQIHDVGKIVISDAVYLKPARLEPIERAQMQLHATRGSELVGRLRDIPERLAEAVRHHHERWDGGGYPDGLTGTQIPLWSRIIAVADAYDAMTENRPYRERPRTHDEATSILREGAGTQWDATAVSAFLEVIEAGELAPKGQQPASFRLGRAASDA